MSTHLRLLIGTRKAAFIYTSDEKRRTWELSAPMMTGWSIYHMAADLRASIPRLYAAANHAVWGPSVAKSDDGGETWEQRSEGLGFAEDMGVALYRVWHVRPGHESRPGVVHAGCSPAGLFRSEDWGVSWTAVDSINRHDHRTWWQPIAGSMPEGAEEWIAGGPPVQSIEIDPRDPDHMYVAISGAYVTHDGCQTWRWFAPSVPQGSPKPEMLVSQAASRVPPDVDPAAPLDMHRMRVDEKNPDRLWTQGHTGVFRSDDGGDSWEDVAEGLPSKHGFGIAITRREPDAAFVVPLEMADANFRVAPGQFAVYRTRDAGSTWERLTDGLPGPHNYQSVYREGMDTDGLDPEGVYVGTSNGLLFASTDGGDHWQQLPGMLPPVLSVTCAVF